MYAIVDIETTGGLAGRHRITEVAVVLHDGEKTTDTWSSLINPEQDIPPFITQLTGISNDMVETAPVFSDIAEELYQILKDRIFVAHNAGFDYAFLKAMFEEEGYLFQNKKLCTVRLGRKILPGHSSYSLGNICRDLGITITDRHRAMGDAKATTTLFEIIMRSDSGTIIADTLKRHHGQQALPPHLDKSVIQELPKKPGVYYFHDNKGRLLYVGKARNIRHRVKNHFNFADHDGHENKLREEIHDVTCTETGNEFTALLLELDEIKRKKPPYNKAQKFWSRNYCIFSYTAQDGYKHLAIERYKSSLQPLRVFPHFLMARAFLKEKSEAFRLCARFCHLQQVAGACYDRQTGHCQGACEGLEAPDAYNDRVDEAISSFHDDLGTFIITGKGRQDGETSVVLVEQGHYLGFGFVPDDTGALTTESIKEYIQWRPDHPDVQYLILRHLEKHPGSRIIIPASSREASA
ncbi:MAG: GIY-YIG nuclease family protein [Chitinophagales bacterium]|nr:GIY-YIG nuclease family protein [Chitinophagales bacterium]HAE34434.1 DNA polymerase III subunit epsilon [Bacteroidota bacterium]MCB9022856.1 GIY-YIG nuclease family protein [Chitinophagales bacterium]HQU39421.1 exonuclease domain-containing protein [Chitinophagales bacterium]HQU76351.1 exonuclease domain-containing protein [Chitinophagales bacterium]